MAPPPIRSQPDAVSVAGRKEDLAAQADEQEHGKRSSHSGDDRMKAYANSQIDIVEVGSSSDSDGLSFDKRSPEPEARQPLGGAEIQRPPKFFHEDNGLRGMAGAPPPDKLPAARKSEPLDLAEAAASADGAHNLHQDQKPDHSGGYFKEGTILSSEHIKTACRVNVCDIVVKRDPAPRLSFVAKRNETSSESDQAKTEPIPVTDGEWSSAIHGAVDWALQNKFKGAAGEDLATEGLPGLSEDGAADAPVLDEAAVEAEAEQLVKTYYDAHPEEKAQVLQALAQMAAEQKEFGNNDSMEQLIKEGASAADTADIPDATAANAKRDLLQVVDSKGKGKEHYHPIPLDPVRDEGLSGVREDGTAEPVPQDEAAMQAAADKALTRGDVPEREIDNEEWMRGLPEQHSGANIDLDEAAKQAPGAMMLHQDHAPDHSGGLFKEGTVGSIPMDDTPCQDDKACLAKRGEFNVPKLPWLPCAVRAGVRSGSCGQPWPGKQSLDTHLEQVEKRFDSLGTLVAKEGKGKNHFHPENDPANAHTHDSAGLLHAAANTSAAEPFSGNQGPKASNRGFAAISKHGSTTSDDDYRASEKIDAVKLNSVSPDSTTAKLLADSERAAVKLDHSSTKEKSSSQFGKRSSRKKEKEAISLKQEDEMYRIVGQQAPVLTVADYAAIKQSKLEGQNIWWSRLKKKLRGHGAEPGRVDYRKSVEVAGNNDGPKAKVWHAATTDGTAIDFKVNKETESSLGKRHSHTPQVKEEDEAKMRGYASSRHLSGAASRKDRQKATESVKEIAKNLEEDREVAQYAAEHRADKMMEKAEARGKTAGHGKSKGKPMDYLDHDTYDPIAAHVAEAGDDTVVEGTKESAWTDVSGGELTDYTTGGHENSRFPPYLGGGATVTGAPNAIGGNIKNAEIGDVGLVLVIGAWVAIVFVILRVARRRSEGETGWLKGRRPNRRNEGYLEDMEEGGAEKRYD